jgi:hypothetical protein
MKHTREEILKAVQVIKDECEEADTNCKGCRMKINGDCLFDLTVPCAFDLDNVGKEATL